MRFSLKLKPVFDFSKALLLTLMVVPSLAADPLKDPLGMNYFDAEAQAREAKDNIEIKQFTQEDATAAARLKQDQKEEVAKDPSNPLFSHVIGEGKTVSGVSPTGSATEVEQGEKESGATGDFTRGSANSSQASLLERLKNQNGQPTKAISQVNQINQLNKNQQNQFKNNQNKN